ncbi:hypothetical protein N836_23240 [Leptolyngbya sp. Heron Island J]|uniref:hypothetical protein n=1 Tax=Leptolyngbya sp. Heron Island J TaxID=1385935 RepID=UPI0003B9D6AF|nr:hypothetical protein [Leptolyngbya sp. Heron Island J]ESA32981.1 hypothetical protein N836_23240 [Leptolyngbya sp. Heron Island J]
MSSELPLAPRYTLDDESPWLVGIDPVRRYWIRANGAEDIRIAIPGLSTVSFETLKEAIKSFRTLPVGATLTLPTFTTERLTIHCLANNLYAVPYPINGALAWHLFDRETIEAFLLTAHPDWQCAPQDIALGRDTIFQSWGQPSAVA